MPWNTAVWISTGHWSCTNTSAVWQEGTLCTCKAKRAGQLWAWMQRHCTEQLLLIGMPGILRGEIKCGFGEDAFAWNFWPLQIPFWGALPRNKWRPPHPASLRQTRVLEILDWAQLQNHQAWIPRSKWQNPTFPPSNCGWTLDCNITLRHNSPCHTNPWVILFDFSLHGSLLKK